MQAQRCVAAFRDGQSDDLATDQSATDQIALQCASTGRKIPRNNRVSGECRFTSIGR
jgi:hypothetical protein